MVNCPGGVSCGLSVVKDPVFSAEQSQKYFHHENTKERKQEKK